MANTGTTGFMEIVNSNINIPYSTASNYDMILRTDLLSQRMFLGNGSNSSNTPALILNSNLVSIGNGIIAPAFSNRIWDFSGTISDTSYKPGVVGQNFRSGSNISVSLLTPFSNINTEGSIYFPGITGNYLTLPQPISTALTDMTIETWIYLPVAPSNVYNGYNIPILLGNQNPTSQATYWSMGINSSNYLSFFNNGSNYAAAPLTPIANNNWYHITICYSNIPKTMQMFVNGILQTLSTWGNNTSGSNTTTAVFSSGISYNTLSPLVIGQNTNVSLNAYVANLRVVNSVLYTSSFTPSAYPLQTYSNTTQLLLRAPLYNPIEHINNIQTYDSLRTHCLPTDAMIYADCYGTNLPNLSGPNTPFFDSNITMSIAFNRPSSNYISFSPQTFNVATKGFTCIVKFMYTSNLSPFERFFEAGNGANNNNIIFTRYSANTLAFYLANNNNLTTILNSSFNFNQNSIYTVTCKYDPYLNNDKINYFGNMSLFVNGSNVSNSNMGLSIGSDRTLQNVFIANNEYGQATLNGNIYNLSVYNRALTDKEIIDASAALMITPILPNQSTIEIGNTNGKPALTVKNDGTIQVAGPINANNNQSYYMLDYGICNLPVSGDIIGIVPALSTSPFNTTNEGSIYISTSNYMAIQSQIFTTPAFLSNASFTCEAWVNYPNFSNVAHSSATNIPLTIGNFLSSGGDTWSFGPTQSSNLGFYCAAGSFNYVTGSNQMQANTWYHIAVSCDTSSNIRIFQNGVLQASAVCTGTVPSSYASNINIGGPYVGGGSGVANMYITNARIVYGSALYTSSFTPPTGPLGPSSSGTTALLLRIPQDPGKVLIPKIGGTTQVQQYPPVALTGNLTNVQNTSYGKGYYLVTNSSEINTTFTGYFAFIYSGVTRWAPGNSPYSTVSPYNYTGSFSTNDISGNTYNGDWLQIKIPEPIVLSSYSFSSLSADIINTFYVLGSIDGINWITLDYNTGASVGGTPVLFQLNGNSKSYQYYRFVITQAGGAITTSLYNCKLYGTQESINVTSDGCIGIGITQPQQQLEVAGNAIFNGNISANNMGMFRNRIINGNMSINQRSITGSNIGLGNGAIFLIDRFAVECSITTGGLTLSNISLSSSDTPYQYGFQNSFRTIATTACSSYNYILPKTAIEGYNIQDFNWGTSYGSPINVSFWLRTSMSSGNICFNIRNDSLSYSYNTNINVVGSNIWQYVSTVISQPPTDSAWNTGNGRGIYMAIGGYQYSALQPSSNVWVNGNNLGTTTTTNVWSIVNNFVEFTGVQLEKGTIATPFEFRPYPIELQLCQRYYYQLSSTTGFGFLGIGVCVSSGIVDMCVIFPVTMRGAPTTLISTTAGNYQFLNFSNPTATSITLYDTTPQTARVEFAFASGTTVGSSGMIRGNNASVYLGFVAEI